MVSARSLRRYRRPRSSRPPSLSWPTFLATEMKGIWAADLFVVQTLTFPAQRIDTGLPGSA